MLLLRPYTVFQNVHYQVFLVEVLNAVYAAFEDFMQVSGVTAVDNG